MRWFAIFPMVLLAVAPSLAGQEVAQEEPSRITALLDRYGNAPDVLIFELGALPELDPAEARTAWNDASEERRAWLALAFAAHGDLAWIESFAKAIDREELAPRHVHLHVVAATRLLGIESSMPSLNDLRSLAYRRSVAADLRRVARASSRGVEVTRTREFLDLAERIGPDRGPASSRALLESASSLGGRLECEFASQVLTIALRSEDESIRRALAHALAHALNRPLELSPGDEEASAEEKRERLLAFLLQLEELMRRAPDRTSTQWIAAGFAELGLDPEMRGALRHAALLEVEGHPSPVLRRHALRELCRTAGMYPDLDLVFFPARSRHHPLGVSLDTARFEKRLWKRLRAWYEKR